MQYRGGDPEVDAGRAADDDEETGAEGLGEQQPEEADFRHLLDAHVVLSACWG